MIRDSRGEKRFRLCSSTSACMVLVDTCNGEECCWLVYALDLQLPGESAHLLPPPFLPPSVSCIQCPNACLSDTDTTL